VSETFNYLRGSCPTRSEKLRGHGSELVLLLLPTILTAKQTSFKTSLGNKNAS
jgi:hypothetical protein